MTACSAGTQCRHKDYLYAGEPIGSCMGSSKRSLLILEVQVPGVMIL